MQCQILPAYLKGLAEKTFYSLTNEQTTTWSAVERALSDCFHPKEPRQVHFSTLRAKLRRPDEDLLQLRCKICRLVELTYREDPRKSLILRLGISLWPLYPDYFTWESVGLGSQHLRRGTDGSSAI